MDRKRFLHICLSKSWGGLEMAVVKWNRILKNRGQDNFNICSPLSPLSESLREEQFHVLEWKNSPYFSPLFSFKLRRFLFQNPVDFILIQRLRDLWLVSPVLFGLKNTKLLGFTQMLLDVKKKDPLHQWIYGPLKYLFTLTDWQKKALMPYLPVPSEKYRTLPNFVDTQAFNPKYKNPDFKKKLGFKDDDFLIGIVGRIDRQKGQEELIKAFSPLAESYPKTHLIIVGEPSLGEKEQQIYYNKLVRRVKEQNLASRIHFLGFEKKPHFLLANLDLFVLPSHRETFGYVLIEAMASGTPVLATESGGVPEILENGELGELCLPKSTEDLREKIDQILKTPQRQKQKAEKALKKAQSFYDSQRVYERFLKIITEKL